MIKDEDFLKWKENKVTKAFFEYCKVSLKNVEDKILNTTPYFQTIHLLSELQGVRRDLRILLEPDLLDTINLVLEEANDGSRN